MPGEKHQVRLYGRIVSASTKEGWLISTPNLAERRRAAGLSQEQLAARAQCAVSTVRLFERGYRPDVSAVRDRVEAILQAAEGAVQRG